MLRPCTEHPPAASAGENPLQLNGIPPTGGSRNDMSEYV